MKSMIRYILPLLLLSVGIQAEPIGLRLPDSTFTAGDIVDIPVYVDSSLDGEGIYAYRIQLQYTASRMQALSAYSAGAVTENFGNPTINTGISGNVILAGAGSTPLSGSGVLFYIRFEMLSAGGTSLSFTNGNENYFNEGSPAMLFDNGYISINTLYIPSISLSPDSRTLLVGDSLQFTVSGDGTEPYNWTVGDESVANISGSGMLHAVDRGETNVRVIDAVGLADSTTGMIDVLNLTLHLPDTSVWQGDTVDIPITYHELSEIDIYSGQFYLSYYANRLTVLEVIQAGTILENYPAVVIHNSPGRTDLAFAATSPIPDNGTLMILRVRALPENSSSTSINFNEVVFNEDVLAQTHNGYLSVTSPPALGISPSSSSPLTAGDTLRFTGTGGIPPYSYHTSNPNIASIDTTGLMTALQNGTVSVTVTDAFGSTRSSSNILIFDTWVSFPDTTAPITVSFDMPLLIDALPAGQEVNSIEATFSYQLPELEFIGIVSEGTFSEGWTFTQVQGTNTLQIAAAGATGFSEAGAILKLRFMISEEFYVGEMAYVRIDDLLLNEGTPAVRTRDGRIQGLELNDPPELTSPTEAAAIEDIYFSYQATATDPEDNPLTFEFTDLPEWLAANADSVYGTPGEGILTGSFTVTVSDGNLTDTQTVAITVTPVNDAPVITSSNNVVATEDIAFTYTATATDPDNTELTFSFEELPAWLTAEGNELSGAPPEGAADTSFLVMASDGELSDTLLVGITVQAVNDAPEITSQDSVVATEDLPFVYHVTAVDPEDSTLVFSFEDLPGWLTATADSVFGVALEGTQDTTFKAIAFDGELSDTLLVQIHVEYVNDPPQIISETALTATEDVYFSFQVQAIDPETDSLSYAFSGLPGWLTANADSIYGIPGEGVLQNSFQVSVTDGELVDSQIITITVAPVNDAPVFSSDTLLSVTEDVYFRYLATATDPEDSTLIFSFDNLPTWANAAADSVYGVPPEGALDAVFTITVSDGELEDDLLVHILVEAVNDAPVIVSLADTSILEDQSISLVPLAEDVDSDSLTYTAWSDTNAVSIEIQADTLLILAPQPDWFGLANIQVMVSDGELSDTTSFQLFVSPVNDPPTAFNLLSPTDSTVNESDTLMVFEWTASSDIDNDSFAYGLYLASEGFELLLSTTDNSFELNIQEFDLPRGEFIRWQVFATDTTDTTWSSENWFFQVDAAVGIASDPMEPDDFVLNQNYPNPFNPSTSIRFAVPEPSHIRLVIYDLRGRQIATLTDAEYQPGWHTVQWSGKTTLGTQASTGIYLVRLQTENFNQVIKMTLMK